jgi:RNA polymerase sigma factor (sigma-70 family)
MANPTGQVIRHLRCVLLADEAGPSDGQLLTRFVEGRDEAAFAAVVKRHGSLVWGVCRRLLSQHDAEDAFQATFLVLCRNAAAIRRREMLSSWLHSVAHQTALHARRTAARRKHREKQVVDMPEPAVADRDPWPDLQPLLDQEINRLPDRYRRVIILCDLEGNTRKEAAAKLGCPEGTVAGWLARARTMLAKRLTQRGIALSGGALAAVLAQAAASARVPASVVSATIRATGLCAAGNAAGAISINVAALTQGVMKAMLLTKLTSALVVAVALVLTLGIGVGLIGYAAAAERPGDAVALQKQTAQRSAPAQGQAGDKRAWSEIRTIKHEHAVTTVACSADWMVVSDEGGNTFAWSTKTGKDRKTLGKGSNVDRLQFTANGKDLYAVWGGRQGIMRHPVKDRKFERAYGIGGGDSDGIARGFLGVSADGDLWLEFFRGGRAILLRPNPYARTNIDPNHHEFVEYQAKVSHGLMSAGDKWLAVVTDDGTLHIHDRVSLEETHTIATGKKVTDVQFSADGQRIAIAGDEGLAKIYDTAKGKAVATLKGHGGIVFAIAFSPDGNTVVTGGDDNAARLWDVATGKALVTLRGHTDSVRCAAFDPGGEILVTGSADKTVKLWRAR